MGTPYTLTEARIIWEIGQRPTAEVADVRRELELDPGYMSRILADFERRGLVCASAPRPTAAARSCA